MLRFPSGKNSKMQNRHARAEIKKNTDSFPQERIPMAWLEHSHVLDNSASSGKALFFEPEVEGLKVQLRGIGCLIHKHAQWFCLKGN